MDGLLMTAKVLLALTILIGVHEWGHYAAARFFKIKVEKFYLFFDFLFPMPNILNFALFKKKIGDTEFGLGWFPLGGYVKIAGMMDESMDKEALAAPPQDWEFRSKPAWQRLIVMLGGIIVNVVVGVIIFTGLNIVMGESYYTIDEVNKNGIAVTKIGEEMGLQKGDKIVNLNGKPFEKFSQVRSPEFLLDNSSYYTVNRNGQEVKVPLPTNLMERLTDAKKEDAMFIDALMPYEITEVVSGMPAAAAGLQKGDAIMAVNDIPTIYFQDLQKTLAENKGKTVTLNIKRNNETKTLSANVNEEGKLGIATKSLLQASTREYGFFEAIGKGGNDAFGVITTQLKGFGKIFRGELRADKALSGPIGIAKSFGGGGWDWVHFWTLTAMLSMVLAFMNLLPIPALDGGHAVFLVYEMIRGKAPSEKFSEITQQIGMLILLGLMAFAFGNDIYKIFAN
jgi:regulator of sigma E protease